MRLGQQVGRAEEQEEAGVRREDVTEPAVGDGQRCADDGSDERGGCVDREPAQRAPPVAALPQHEPTVLIPSAKSWLMTARKTSSPVAVLTCRREPDPETVKEAVQ